MKFIVQAFVLIVSFTIVFIWQQTSFSGYTVQALGFLVFLYLILAMRKKGKGFLTMGGEGPWGIFILNTVILLLIFATGSISSNLFFLLYFLGFGIAFVFEAQTIFVFIAGAVLVFLPDALKGDTFGNFIKLGSLLFISPLAYFFGREYRKSDKQEDDIEALEERTKEASDTISEDIEEVIENEKQNLKQEDMEKLNQILEETDDLRQESKKN